MEIEISKTLHLFNPELREAIEASAEIVTFPEGSELIREGQYINVVPIVVEGLIKVFTHYEDKELLLYYIRPKESCVMSFAANFRRQPSKIFAVCEENTTVMLLPVDKFEEWTRQYPEFNALFLSQYNQRYSELIDTINHLLFDRMDKRLLDYLVEKVKLTNKNPLKISHRQIASDLGSAREVISRMMKKLESEGLVKQLGQSIEVKME